MPAAQNQVAPVLRAAAQAIAKARADGDLIAAIGNEFPPNAFLMNLLRRHASIAGTDGSRWTEMLPLGDARYFPKWAGSAFVNPDLHRWLVENRVTTLILAGLMAKACITATARDALAKG